MNINAITKHYDKLSTVERFTLLNAALSRGDDTDLITLRQSAPRKTWSIPTTRGLGEAFDFLAMFHIMAMQEYNALHYLLLSLGDDGEAVNIDGYTYMELLEMIQARTLARDIAWREVCKEYNLNADEIIGDCPGAESVRFFVTVMKRYNESYPVEVDPAECLADLRGVIELKRKEWE